MAGAWRDARRAAGRSPSDWRSDFSCLREPTSREVVDLKVALAGQWHIAEGAHRVALGKAADSLVLTAEAKLSEQLFGS